MKIIYLAHPVAGDIRANTERIEAIYRELLLHHDHVVPFAPYLTTLRTLENHSGEDWGREIGMDANYRHFHRKSFDELALFGPRISDGMWKEVAWAVIHHIPVAPTDELADDLVEGAKSRGLWQGLELVAHPKPEHTAIPLL